MKPFNLDEYLANPNRKVVTRDGRDVRIICTDFDNPYYPVICEIKGYKWPLSFATNGEAIKGRQLSGDLFFAPEKHEGWINILRYEKHICPMVCIYDSKEKAEENANIGRNCVATVKIEWEE